MTTGTYVVVGLMAAVGVGAWVFRGKLATLGAQVQEQKRARLKAEAEARMREEWNNTDAKTNKMLNEARDRDGRGARLRGMLSNRPGPSATPTEPDVPTPEDSGG